MTTEQKELLAIDTGRVPQPRKMTRVEFHAWEASLLRRGREIAAQLTEDELIEVRAHYSLESR